MVCHVHPFMDTRSSIRNLFIVDCGFRAHKKCSEKLPNDCMPNMKKLKRMFGLDLTTLLKATNKSIPYVVEKCVEEIERRGKLTYKHEYYKLNTIAHLMFHFGPAKISSSIKTIANTGDVNHASVLKKHNYFCVWNSVSMW